MDSVVLHSDIARLVLGYLKRQNLERTSRSFCKTSPHLKQEFSAYKKGFTPHSFCPDLEDIICEYVNITLTVDGILTSLPKNLRVHLFEHKLSEKVKFLLERALDSYIQSEYNENDTAKRNDNIQSSTASTSLHSDKENTAKKHNKQKRRRSSLLYSSDDRKSPIGTKPAKRRRVLGPFCYLSSKQVLLKRQHTNMNTSSTGEEQTQTDDEYDEDTANDEENELEDDERNAQLDYTNLSIMEKPTKESTPRIKTTKGKFFGPSLPELSQAVLDNPQFQMKLVDNINQALNKSTSTEAQVTLSKKEKTTISTEDVNTASTTNALSEEQQIINSNEMLDQMVKDILKATEKDPAFDAIIENVVGASIQPNNVSAGVQCNIDTIAQGPMLSMPVASAMTCQPQQQQFALVQQPQQQLQQHLTAIPSLPTISHQTAEAVSASNVPRTPLIIRTAVSAGNSTLNAAGESQLLSSLTANNSFGSLIDPNFSISKLIVLNPNESAQKQPPSGDQSIGNTTADHIIHQLAGVEAPTDEQVYFDANTGQLTIPLFLTDEGLLANFPFLVNNEAVTQQLLPDNISNLDGSHIEIPLPEPIIVSADQLPPNSIIVTSAQKAIIAEEQRLPNAPPPRTECKKSKNVPAPTSLNVRLNTDRETPSTSGIVNTKAYKSLSTPRKRTSHVRTLSFSPKVEGSQPTILAGATPLSTRRVGAQREAAAITETEENKELNNSTDIPVKPIIKNVEILPCLGGASAVDVSANESSNSCSVPPLFVTEESSNQTVIKTELSLRELRDVSLSDNGSKGVKEKTDTKYISTMPDHSDTPKRKQIRRTAVRACKRQISKSSDEDKKPKSTNDSENDEPKKITSDCEQSKKDENEVKLQDEKMMEEWLRLRSATTSDLDSRLRQLNAAYTAALPKSLNRKKDTLLKRRKLRRKKTAYLKRSAQTADLEHESDNRRSLDASAEDKDIKMGNECDDKSRKLIDSKVEKTPKGKSGHDKKRSSKDRHREFNIKIPTPQKDKRESSMKMRSERTTDLSPEMAQKSTNDAVDNNTAFQIPMKRAESSSKVVITEQHLEQERDRRTANIACLLETPFKAPTTMDEIPPTPGISASLLDTPATKLDTASEEIHSTSYLFGSLTKSDIETPQLSAITPGLRFTSFGSSRDVTPRSMAPATDYSSGGSYYKPDESDDLDKNFDKILKDSAQKRKEEEENVVKAPEKHSNEEEVEDSSSVDQKQSAICVEIPAEKLRVEPIVLKRVKSFGAEGTENPESSSAALNINPHYTLVSELPEICAEEESSNSSSTFSSSSSSSSDSSSTSSSSSHSITVTHKDEVSPSVDIPHKTPDKVHLSLDNLSSISSTEDEEWQKLAVTEEENSQLVSNDGEVRYPVRSWLTPSKADKEATDEAHESALPTTIKVTVPLKSTEKRNRLEDDLHQKRERIMEKLKQDANQRREKHSNVPSTPPSGMSAALSATRKIVAMREKTKSQPVKAATATVPKPKEPVVEVEERRTIEVLTALQLSAKKPATQHSAASGSKTKSTTVAPLLGACDDNAVSTIFSNTTTTYELTEKTERLPIKTLISKVRAKQRKCLQIEPLPVLKASRSSRVGRKKIVRNPLGFRGTIKPPDAVTELEEVKSPLKVVTTSAAGGREKEEENDSECLSPKVSPIPRIKIKAAVSHATTSSKLRVSPRLQASKDPETKGNDEVVRKQQLKKLKDTKILKPTEKATKKLLAGRINVAPAQTKAMNSKKVTLGTSKRGLKESEKATIDKPSEVQAITIEQETIVKDEKEQIRTKVTTSDKEEQQTSKVQKTTKVAKATSANVKSVGDKEQSKFKDIPMTKEDVERTKSETAKLEISAAEKKQIEEGIETTTSVTKEESERSKSAVAEDTKCTTSDIANTEAFKIKSQETQNKAKSDTDKNKDIPAKSTADGKLQNEKEIASTSINSECIAAPTSTTNIEPPIEISEDDPLEGCELTTVTEDDPVRYIRVSYDGPDESPTNPLPRRDFTNFKMVVAFDENEKHIWRISDELVLFNAAPSNQQIRNIPKKRRVRISTCGSDDDNVTTVGVVHSTTTTTTTTLPTTSTRATVAVAESSLNTSNNTSSKDNTTVNSTPRAVATSSSNQKSKGQRLEDTKSSAMSEELTASTTAPPPPVGNTEVLQMDEIESLLSHLHGTAK